MAIRVAVYAVPLVAGALTAIALHAAVPRPAHGWSLAAWWALGVTVCSLAVAGAFRVAQRALRLATLLRLSLVFPERTPSRMKVAFDARSDAPVATAAEAVILLAAALDSHDRVTKGHSERVGALSDALGREMGVSEEDRVRLRWAALLHDCGKLKVEESVLNKPGPLDESEWEQIRFHPEAGDALIDPIREWLGPWALTVAEHHERWDGDGYPHGVRGGEISLGARIVAVADSFDVMTSLRSYKRPISPAAAREELTRCAGTQFDPDVVRAFLGVSTRRVERLWPVAVVAQIPMAAWFAATGRVRRVALRGATLASTSVAVLGSVVALTGGAALVSSAPVIAAAPHDAFAGAVIPPQVEASGSVAQPVGDAPAPVADAAVPDAPAASPHVLARKLVAPVATAVGGDHLVDVDLQLDVPVSVGLRLQVLPGISIVPTLPALAGLGH